MLTMSLGTQKILKSHLEQVESSKLKLLCLNPFSLPLGI
jgi:hypothetical protein